MHALLFVVVLKEEQNAFILSILQLQPLVVIAKAESRYDDAVIETIWFSTPTFSLTSCVIAHFLYLTICICSNGNSDNIYIKKNANR